MRNNKFKDTLSWWLEMYLPIMLGFIGAILIGIYSFKGEIKNYQTVEKILDSTITFSSITVGFVGALLGILFSIRDTETIRLLFAKTEKDTLKKYFNGNLITGIVLVFISLSLYIKDEIDGLFINGLFNIKNIQINPSVLLFTIWGFMLFYMLASTYRITSIMMHIIFSDDKTKQKELEPVKMGEKEKNELKMKHKRKEP